MYLPKDMSLLTITSIIISLHISVSQATCNRTNSLLKNEHQDSRTYAGMNNQTNPYDLISLRVEYNKYKILSHLGITGNPDDRTKPEVNDELLTEAEKKYLNHHNTNTNNEYLSNEPVNLRHKRSLACNQVKSDKDACCLETFYVNFTEIGWDKWILYPVGYNANYCRGQCDLSHARQMSPLRLLFIDENNKVHQKSIPDMVVESCDCA